MSNYVRFDIVANAIKKHGYVVYYMRDTANNLQYFNEDVSATADTIIQEIKDLIPYCTGQYINIELRKLPIGDGTKGGNMTTTSFKFKVLLDIEVPHKQPQQSQQQNIIPGMPTVYDMFQENQKLQMQLFEMSLEKKLEKLEQERNEYRSKANSPVLDKAVDKIFEKFVAADDAKTAAKEAQKVKELAPLADEDPAVKDRKNKILGSIKTFKNVDADYIENLNFLAEYASKNPTVYKAFLENLKASSNE
jgi:hypothetical protein